MKTYTKEELASALEKHAKWLRDEDGERANLSRASLSWAQVGFSEHGECGRMLVAFQATADSPVMFQCGCFYGSGADLRNYIESGAENLRESRSLALECAMRLIAYRKGEQP